jgi:hypothetical protein
MTEKLLVEVFVTAVSFERLLLGTSSQMTTQLIALALIVQRISKQYMTQDIQQLLLLYVQSYPGLHTLFFTNGSRLKLRVHSSTTSSPSPECGRPINP